MPLSVLIGQLAELDDLIRAKLWARGLVLVARLELTLNCLGVSEAEVRGFSAEGRIQTQWMYPPRADHNLHIFSLSLLAVWVV
jgi:hypothetical protein